MKTYTFRKEEIKLPLFTGDTFIYIENLKQAGKKIIILTLKSDYGKFVR